MKCINSMEDALNACGVRTNPTHIMEIASANVGLNLMKPVDLSGMNVHSVSNIIEDSEYSFKTMILRTSILHCYLFNEYGEREEVTVTFELKSPRGPKVNQENIK